MKTLDRSFFKKDLDLAAACVVDRKKIASFQKELSKDILKLERLPPTRPVPSNVTADSSARCLLLKPEVQVDGRLGFNRKVGNCYVDRLR